MNPTKPTLNFTPAMFFTGPQEVVLAYRHGRCDEEDTNHRMDRTNIYQATEAQLRHRELSNCEITIETPGLITNLQLKRCYHHEGRLCRVHYLSESASEIRKQQVKSYEIELAQVAAWAAARYFATPPLGIRLIYHVLAAEETASPIAEAWVVDLPLAPRAKIEALVSKRLGAIAAALNLPDEALPECDMDERHGTDAKPFKKCLDSCRARKTCCQFACYLAKKANSGQALGKLLSAAGKPVPKPTLPSTPS